MIDIGSVSRRQEECAALTVLLAALLAELVNRFRSETKIQATKWYDGLLDVGASQQCALTKFL
jgi:hypothetical protein